MYHSFFFCLRIARILIENQEKQHNILQEQIVLIYEVRQKSFPDKQSAKVLVQPHDNGARSAMHKTRKSMWMHYLVWQKGNGNEKSAGHYDRHAHHMFARCVAW